MARDPYGSVGRTGKEWGSKARKEETDLRGMNHAADRAAVAEQVAELDDASGSVIAPWADNDPCTCLVTEDYPHTIAEHWRDACSQAERCGGCWDCMAMQVAHYNELERQQTASASR